MVQRVVFRLKDRLPREVVPQLRLMGKTHRLHRTDAVLDAGYGTRLLADPRCAQIVVEALHHFDGERYCLVAWCVMPTHVHVVVEPQFDHALGAIVKSWKSYSAVQINRTVGRAGSVWAADYFDRFMRDDDQLSTTFAYVEDNPVVAGLATTAAEWPFSSARERAALRA